ncbi:CaiB/BaiF CoA-transferase family protein [Variovorax sp. Sphag1AA]|uniref:CaiB/BaiF CoA transferase family protein n=1 Tax=Variovorax sp. Sphag1AA TaxID=2587027 RepID=UPI00160E7563|nr:CoA transferase [Variovorax sp. Sphag1AA]MBB3181120.1 formyl-CoA transferase [Variovorax sp. Sphag1AA]
MPTARAASRPLEGIQVIELAHLIAGPYCGQMLADEGANVIKIEPPGGELTRHRPPARQAQEGEVTAYYASLNRGKSSVVLDLKNAEAADILDRLLQGADVFVTNMRSSALERLGIHPDVLHARYPRLVIACISGFGLQNSGEYADRAGLAMVAEAMAGATGLTRDHKGNAVWCGFALGDIMAAVSAHAGILLALRNQERYGVGKVIDVGLVECMLPMVSVALSRAQIEEKSVSDFAGSNNFHGVPYGAFPAADGAVNIGCNRDDFWRRLCAAIGRPELASDPRYATYNDRMRHQHEVHAITESFTRVHTRAEITARLVEFDVPVAGILSMEEVVDDPYLRRRGALCKVEDGFGGTFTLPANPAWLDDDDRVLRVPRLGEQRDAVLGHALSLDAEEIARLEQAGAFGAGRQAGAGESRQKDAVHSA